MGAEKTAKDLEALKNQLETALKENVELKKAQQELANQVKDNIAKNDLVQAENNRKVDALNKNIDYMKNKEKARQSADAETVVKVVDLSVATQANTTTAGPVITDHTLPLDGAQVLPLQGVPQGLNSSTPWPPRGAMHGARAQSYHGPREYVNQNFSSHWSITFQDPLVQQP